MATVDELRLTLEENLEMCFPDAMRFLVEETAATSIRDTGATADSVDWQRDDRLTGTIFADTPQAAIQDAGTEPYMIRPKTKKALFWEGAMHPVGKVNHPGVTKHRGWWTDAPWEQRWCDALNKALA